MTKLSFFLTASALCATLFIGGCDFAKNQLVADRESNLEIQDYKDALAPRLPEVDDTKSSVDRGSIPALQSYVGGVGDVQSSMPLVSISVNQTVPLRDVLYELAQQGNYDIELDPRIVGAIIFSAREKPLDVVIERISDMAGLRYKFEDETIRVELDTPYNEVYKVDYLTLVRSNSSSISNDISVVSGDGADTGSSFESSFENEIDFWTELEANLTQILAATNTQIMRTSSDPEITAAPQPPLVVPVAAPDASGNVQVSPPNVNLNVGLPTSGGATEYEAPDVSYAINKQAGILQIFAPQKTQDQVAKYLKLLKKSVTAQVLIEAKILEVNLSDQHSKGISWDAVLGSGEFSASYLSASDFNSDIISEVLPSVSADATSLPVLSYIGNDFAAGVSALSEFGTVNALASPRMTVMNNQTALLNVTTNKVFFELDVEQTPSTDGADPLTTIESELRNVPVGVLVNVQPSINLENGTISMALRPTITAEDGPGINDPAVSLISNTINSVIPQLTVREIDTIVQAKSGQTIVLGGLLQDRNVTRSNGIPGLSEIPVMGSLFKQNNDEIQKTEVVIFLKATILENPSDSVHNTDKDLYRKFSRDRRPLKL